MSGRDCVVLTVEEAAKLLRIGRSAAYEAVRRGELPALHFGRTIRVPRESIEAMIRSAGR
jgi:excisionase family DNA binding protein